MVRMNLYKALCALLGHRWMERAQGSNRVLVCRRCNERELLFRDHLPNFER